MKKKWKYMYLSSSHLVLEHCVTMVYVLFKVTCLDVTEGGLAVSSDSDGQMNVWTTEQGDVRVNFTISHWKFIRSPRTTCTFRLYFQPENFNMLTSALMLCLLCQRVFFLIYSGSWLVTMVTFTHVVSSHRVLWCWVVGQIASSRCGQQRLASVLPPWLVTRQVCASFRSSHDIPDTMKIHVLNFLWCCMGLQ